jgi:hypothetical protein
MGEEESFSRVLFANVALCEVRKLSEEPHSLEGVKFYPRFMISRK